MAAFAKPLLCAGRAISRNLKKNKMKLEELCKQIMGLNHMGVQSDHIHYCEEMHQTIRLLDKMDKHEAIRLLMHVIHVQQLQLVGAKIELDNENPFRDMVNFDYINDYVRGFSPDMENKVENKQSSRNDDNTVLCAGREYKTKFKEGDRVTAEGYCGVLVLYSVDEMLTSMLRKLHWNTISESYLQGKSKTNNGEVYSESELSPCT